jgi:Family of unknown function (DUF6014)
MSPGDLSNGIDLEEERIAMNELQINQHYRSVVNSVRGKKLPEAASELRRLAGTCSSNHANWLSVQATALETSVWDALSDGFQKRDFISPEGYFFLAAPYRAYREGIEDIQLTALYGKCLPVSPLPLSRIAEYLGKELDQPSVIFPEVKPVIVFSGCGHVDGEAGEAFFTSNNWRFSGSESGLTLNDMTEQHRRFQRSGRKCIKRIFSPETAQFLLSTLTGSQATQNRHNEYAFHECGHASGLGLTLKIQHGLFPSFLQGAAEEWRADGIEFLLGQQFLSEEELAQLVAVNICVRMGLDAHRRGTPDRDADALASLLTLNGLLQSGLLIIKAGRLHLKDSSTRGLRLAVEPHTHRALEFTRKELNMAFPEGFVRLSAGLFDHLEQTRQIFDGLVVEPCRNFFTHLR